MYEDSDKLFTQFRSRIASELPATLPCRTLMLYCFQLPPFVYP